MAPLGGIFFIVKFIIRGLPAALEGHGGAIFY
jgi:hypothetical protein